MKNMRRSGSHIEITDTAWADLVNVADGAKPLETGGILLGYRERGKLCVVGVVEVPDPGATPTTYTLRSAEAQKLLNKLRSWMPAQSPVGYLGDWHSHLGNSAPSQIDRQSLSRLGQQYRGRMAGIIVARHSDQWHPHGLIATRFRIRSCSVRVLQKEVE